MEGWSHDGKAATMPRMDEDYEPVIRELRVMQDRLQALRFRLGTNGGPENIRYRSFSGAVSHLNKVIDDLAKDVAKRSGT
jgi:hypothetical protein